MNFFERYLNYLRDNPEGYWFKAKVFGWGWEPATWQGWALLATFLAVFTWIFVPFVNGPEPTDSAVTWFLIKTFAWAAALIAACWATGEPPKWQWGIPDKKNN